MGRAAVTVYAALLRAINVGGTGIIRMADLKALCAEIGFGDAQTLLQSGNIVFTSRAKAATVAEKLASAIEAGHGFRPTVIVRTADELADVIARNPFPEAAEAEPNRLLVSFLAGSPARDAAGRAGGEAILGGGE